MILQSFSRVLRSVCVGACTPQWRTWRRTAHKGGILNKSIKNLNDCKKACAKDKNCRGINSWNFKGFAGKPDQYFCVIVDRAENDEKETAKETEREPKKDLLELNYYELTRNCARGQLNK